MTIIFTVEGPPQGKGRPRINTVTKRAYTPKKTQNYEALIALKAGKAMQGRAPIPKDRPVMMAVKAYFPVPKSDSNARRTAKLVGSVARTEKPDLDNIIKSICDACQGIVFENDSQIDTIGESFKRYGDPARVEIMFTERLVNYA